MLVFDQCAKPERPGVEVVGPGLAVGLVLQAPRRRGVEAVKTHGVDHRRAIRQPAHAHDDIRARQPGEALGREVQPLAHPRPLADEVRIGRLDADLRGAGERLAIDLAARFESDVARELRERQGDRLLLLRVAGVVERAGYGGLAPGLAVVGNVDRVLADRAGGGAVLAWEVGDGGDAFALAEVDREVVGVFGACAFPLRVPVAGRVAVDRAGGGGGFAGPGVFAVGSFSFLIAIFFAPAPDSSHRKHVDRLFEIMKTPVDFEAEIGDANDDKQLTIIGRFGAAIAGFVALMLIIPNPIQCRLTILALSHIIGGISALMIRAGAKLRSIK